MVAIGRKELQAGPGPGGGDRPKRPPS